jgi:aminopeptidase N
MVLWRGLVVGVLVCGVAVGQRLPRGVRPEHYGLVLTPNLAERTFAGDETIDVVLDAPATAITVNAVEIRFLEVKAYEGQKQIPFGNDKQEGNKQKGSKQKGSNKKANAGILRYAQDDKRLEGGEDALEQTAVVTLDEAKEQATFTFAKALPAGPVRLSIRYTGLLNDKLRGFYLSKTKARSYAISQLEPTDARRAFPSFDEPALKATFDISLVVAAGDTGISNSNLVSDTPGPSAGTHTLKFGTTPKMSTYLVAFLVGDFKCSSGKEDGVPIRVCATPDKVALTPFALEAAKYFLHYYDQYFGIKYPMPKLDLVAIPDFEAGAMENFGCITFRETELLVDRKNGPVPAKKEVAETVAHEMAHQWFGDMVTMQWWDNLWLNEGFATWMETKAAARWHPDWHYAEDVASDLDSTLDSDAQPATRAIRARADTPAQINEMFDDIAYGKAGAVIGMVENYVGEEVFRQGVHAYLAAHLYANATAEDFWNTQTATSKQPVDKIMASFIEQPGVPLLTFGEPQAAGIPVSQSRFYLSQAEMNRPLGGRIPSWIVPACVETGGKRDCHLLDGTDQRTPGLPMHSTLSITKPVANGFLYANAGDKGYYRTEYIKAQLAAIIAKAEAELTPAERIGLVGDQWALARAGRTTVGDFLNLLLALKRDPDVAVVDSELDKLRAIKNRIATEEDRARLNAVIRAELGPVYVALGASDKRYSYDRAELRDSLFQALGEAKDPAALAEAARLTEELFAGHKPSNPDVADAAVDLTAATGDAPLFERLMRVSQNATDPDLKVDALRTLARFSDPALVARTLDYAASGKVRNQDSWVVFAILMTRPETRDQAWEYVQQHWATIAAQLTVNSGARIVEAAGSFCTAKQRDEVAGFFAEHPVQAADRTLQQSLDSIDACVQLRAAQEPNLKQWLDAHEAKK